MMAATTSAYADYTEPYGMAEASEDERIKQAKLGMRLTIIEDDEALAQSLSIACRNLGFDVCIITNEASYRQQRSRPMPDVLLLDLNIGFGTGLDCLERMIAEGFSGYTVLMSGCDDRVFRFSEDICRDLGARVLASMQKPFSLQELTSILTPIAPETPLLQREEYREALAQNHIVPFFQPIVNLNTNQLAGAEILARWQHPDHGLMPPSRFIVAFEELGMMNELTTLILARGLEAIRQANTNDQDINLSVNVSPSILLEPGFSDRFIETIVKAGGQPHNIKIEITEAVAFAGLERIMRVLTRLRIEGIKLSIDDFGTGYSSLTALHQLPFSDLKIDRSFTGRIIQDPEAEKIVHSLIDLAHSLGLNVVAEGAETHEVIELLKEKNCDMAQGYFFSRPLSAEEFIKWRDHNYPDK